MYRRIGAIAAAGAAVAAAAAPSAATAATKTVFAGPPPTTKALAIKLGITGAFVKKYNPDFNDFFLHRVTINRGDTVSFRIDGFHTIDLPGASGQDLPLIVAGPKISGINDAAGNPFWFNGQPSLGVNPQLFRPIGGHTYNGSARVASGIPLGSGPPKPFNITFTKPGVYKYFCDVHHGMIGYVVVRGQGTPVPSARQDAAALKAQLTRDIRSAKRLARSRVPAGRFSLGESDRNGVELYQMFPATLRVNVGTVVRFSMSLYSRDTHTASFGPLPYLKKLSNGIPTQPTPTQIGFYPSGPTLPIPLNQSSHGNGFANTGALDEDPGTRQRSTSTIKFTQPGTYSFVCLIHPFMRATVIVR
jgi:plastocyanin